MVADGKVIFGFDVHNSGKGFDAGIVAVERAHGTRGVEARDGPVDRRRRDGRRVR